MFSSWLELHFLYSEDSEDCLLLSTSQHSRSICYWILVLNIHGPLCKTNVEFLQVGVSSSVDFFHLRRIIFWPVIMTVPALGCPTCKWWDLTRHWLTSPLNWLTALMWLEEECDDSANSRMRYQHWNTTVLSIFLSK